LKIFQLIQLYYSEELVLDKAPLALNVLPLFITPGLRQAVGAAEGAGLSPLLPVLPCWHKGLRGAR